MNDYDGAERDLLEATYIARQTGQMRILQETLYELAEICHEKIRLDEALAYVNDSQAIAGILFGDAASNKCSKLRSRLIGKQGATQ